MTYQITSALLGLTIAFGILFLVRRDHLHGTYAVWWLGVAVIAMLLGLFPQITNWLAIRTGVGYPPILAIVLGFGLLLIKMLTMDLERSRQERQIRRLAQRLALLEAQPPQSDLDQSVSPPDPPT